MKNLTKTAVVAFAALILSATAHAGPGLMISDRAATAENTGIIIVGKEESADKGGMLVSDRAGLLLSDRAGMLVSDRAGMLISDRDGILIHDRAGLLVSDRSGILMSDVR